MIFAAGWGVHSIVTSNGDDVFLVIIILSTNYTPNINHPHLPPPNKKCEFSFSRGCTLSLGVHLQLTLPKNFQFLAPGSTGTSWLRLWRLGGIKLQTLY